MFFTEEDYRKIESWLHKRAIKDSELPHADEVDGNESIAVVQHGINKTVAVRDFIKQIATLRLPDFYNVTDSTGIVFSCFREVLSAIPVEKRKIGLVITFFDKEGWKIYQFKGDSLNQWDSMYCWVNIVHEAIKELIYHPDEEDITYTQDGNRMFLKFKDRIFSPEEFSGLGMIILRKNLEGTEACSIDDEDHYINILSQDMINKENTIYVIQYDFDLNGKTIAIPKNCVLKFQGGSINNGRINVNEAAILGAFEFADMGNVELFGKFNKGQVMTFINNEYKSKEGNYFMESSNPSSATKEEDANNDTEVIYITQAGSYKTKKRQELRWWNGSEWLLLLDIADYNEIKSIIKDLIDKHNAEMSACYKYFKKRIYTLENRVTNNETTIENHETRISNNETNISNNTTSIDNINNSITNIEGDITNIENSITTIESNISNIEGDITNLGDTVTNISNDVTNINKSVNEVITHITEIDDSIKNIDDSITTINNSYENIVTSVEKLSNSITNIDNTINESVENYLSTVVLGINSITVNNTKYEMDEDGNITLPDYPSKVDSSSKADEATKAEEASRVTGTLKVTTFEGESLGSYNGSEDVTIALPEFKGGEIPEITPNENLIIKQGETVLGTYNGSEEITIDLPKSETVSTEVIKEVVVKEEILKYFEDFTSRTIENFETKLSSTLNSEIIKDTEAPLLSNKRFFYIERIPNIDPSVNKYNVYNALNSDGEIFNLNTVGFNTSLYDSVDAECGVIYSNNSSFFDSFSLAKFLNIGDNTDSLGKIKTKRYKLDNLDINNKEQYVSYLDPTVFSSIKKKKLFIKTYIYVPSKSIFYSAIDIEEINILSILNNLGTIDYNGYVVKPTSAIDRDVTFSDVSVNGDNIEFTITLKNLYVVDSSTAGFCRASSTNDEPTALSTASRIARGVLQTPFANINEGTFQKLSENKYKVSVNLFSYYYSYLSGYLFVTLATDPNNTESNYSLADRYIYISNKEKKTIKKLERSDLIGVE